MSFSPIDRRRAFRIACAACALAILEGCIADTAEDTNLPWATNKSWEGVAPISPEIMDRYE